MSNHQGSFDEIRNYFVNIPFFDFSVWDSNEPICVLSRRFNRILTSITDQGVSQEDAQLRLIEASVSSSKREIFIVALFYTLLVDHHDRESAWNNIVAICQGDYSTLIRNAGFLAADKFPRLQETCQTQVIELRMITAHAISHVCEVYLNSNLCLIRNHLELTGFQF